LHWGIPQALLRARVQKRKKRDEDNGTQGKNWAKRGEPAIDVALLDGSGNGSGKA